MKQPQKQKFKKNDNKQCSWHRKRRRHTKQPQRMESTRRSSPWMWRNWILGYARTHPVHTHTHEHTHTHTHAGACTHAYKHTHAHAHTHTHTQAHLCIYTFFCFIPQGFPLVLHLAVQALKPIKSSQEVRFLFLFLLSVCLPVCASLSLLSLLFSLSLSVCL